MANTKVLQSNFSSGELSEKAQGRTDIARYPNAAAILENVVSRTLGSADKRAGLEWLARTKDMTKRSRLVPYVISQDEAYMLEMGAGYLRVFTPDGKPVLKAGAPYEVTTVYDEIETAQIDEVQGEDAMYLFHQDVHPHRLRTFGADVWDVSPAPFTTTPFAEIGDYPAANLTLSLNTVGTGRTVNASASVFMSSCVGRAILAGAGIAVITGFTSGTQVTVEVKVVFASTAIASGTWNRDSSPQATLTPGAKDPVGAITSLALSAPGWRSGTDVGKFVRLNGGLIQITSVTDAQNASGKIIKELTAVTAVPALAWTLESSVWGGINGFPRTGAIHEQRLVTAGTYKKPQTIWGSRSGEPLDFTIGTADDDAYSFTIGTSGNNESNPIGYLISATNLLALTYGGEFSLRGGNEKAISPTVIKIKNESPHGCKKVAPIQVGKETLFAQRAGRKLRATKFEYSEDGYKPTDLTVLGEHLTKGGIAGYCFQQEPDPIIWIWLENGRLISVTLDRDLDVIAWNRHKIDGAVEWVASMPAGDKEQVWMIVRRKVDGAFVRYIERMQPDWLPIYGSDVPDPDVFPPEDEPDNWGFQLDCAVTQDDEDGKATWDGLDHLEGREVGCIADGVYMGTFTVEGGQITLPRDAKRVLIGLVFLPRIKLLTPEIQMAGGTSQAATVSTYGIWVNVYQTIGLVVNGEEVIPGRNNGPNQLDMAPELFTGRKKLSMTGWSQVGISEPEITQSAPMPFSLLAVTRKLTLNE